MRGKTPATLLALAVVAAGLTLAPTATANLTNGSENFDGKIAGLNPSGNFYTYTAGTQGVGTQTTYAHTAPNGEALCLNCQGSPTGNRFNFGSVASSAGFAGSISFWFYLVPQSTGTTGNNPAAFRVQFESSSGTQFGANFGGFAGIQGSGTTATYSVTADKCQSSGTSCTSGTAIPGVTQGAWHHLTASGFNPCGSSTGWVLVIDNQGSQSTAMPSSCSTNWDMALYANMGGFGSGCSPCTNGAQIYIDDITITGGDTFVPTVAFAAQSTNLGTINGFDVDAGGQTAIVRLGGSLVSGSHYTQAVRTLDASTLAGSSTLETNCNRVNGVDTIGGFTISMVCSASNAAVMDHWAIRNAALTNPDLPQLCKDGDFCDLDLAADSVAGQGALAGDQSVMSHVVDTQAFPYDFSVGSHSSDGLDHVFAAWGVSLYDGTVGVLAYTWQNNGIDNSNVRTTSLTSTAQAADQLCTIQDPNGFQYLYASSSTSNAKGWRVDMTREDGSAVPPVHPSLSVDALTPSFPGTSSTANAAGVACGFHRFAVLTTSNVQLFLRNATSAYGTIPIVSGAQPAGITMSLDGEYVAWVSSSKWHVAHASNGTIAAEGTMPAGTFCGMRLNGHASQLWTCTGGLVTRFAIYPYTTGADVGFNVGTEGSPGQRTPGGSVATATSTSTGSSAGGGVVNLGSTLANLIGSGALVLGCVVVGFGLTSNKRRRREEE